MQLAIVQRHDGAFEHVTRGGGQQLPVHGLCPAAQERDAVEVRGAIEEGRGHRLVERERRAATIALHQLWQSHVPQQGRRAVLDEAVGILEEDANIVRRDRANVGRCCSTHR